MSSKITNSNLEFRKIPSLDFLYEVNENGTIFRNVKSKKQLAIRLDTHHSEKGYYATWVNIKGKVKRVMIHSVVAECWIGPRPEGLQIDHIDRNSQNNDYRNLRYVNQSQQMKNRVLGERIINQAKENCKRWNESISIGVIATNAETGEVIQASSLSEASRLLANYYNEPDHSEKYRYRLKEKRQKIFDFDIEYAS